MQSLIRMSNTRIFLSHVFMMLSIVSCKKLVDIQAPITSINQANVYANDATAIAVLTGIYIDMNGNTKYTGGGSISLCAGLSADELTLWSGLTTDTRYYFYTNSLSTSIAGAPGTDFWSSIYGAGSIFSCNAAIEGLASATSLTPSIQKRLLGEAKFMRAFFYFYLVNLYGDVPLLLSTNWQVNATMIRTPKAQVYQQIINDLKDAQNLLTDDYVDGNLQPYSGMPERVRPNRGAAIALLARAYLYSGDYPNAEAQATEVINNSSQYSLVTLDSVFFKNNAEAIWQLQPTTSGHNTEDGWTFILPLTGPGSSWPVYLNRDLLKSFEYGDLRSTHWVNSVIVAPDTFYYAYKYKSATLNDPVIEYLAVLRLGEQYLIRAEARAQINDLVAAKSDLNTIRARAGLDTVSVNDRASLLTAILHERQVELFTEWGHRWFDLKRTGNIDAIMDSATLRKGGTGWSSYQQLYPLPVSDIRMDRNLTQNQGYQ